MTQQEQEQHFEGLTSQMKQILFKKGNDYANTDRLSNFKLAGTICGLTAEQNCLSLIATKVARLGVLLSGTGKTPNNESIRDSILDLANYAVLLDMLVGEKDKEKDRVCRGNWDEDGKCKCKGSDIIDAQNNMDISDFISHQEMKHPLNCGKLGL